MSVAAHRALLAGLRPAVLVRGRFLGAGWGRVRRPQHQLRTGAAACTWCIGGGRPRCPARSRGIGSLWPRGASSRGGAAAVPAARGWRGRAAPPGGHVRAPGARECATKAIHVPSLRRRKRRPGMAPRPTRGARSGGAWHLMPKDLCARGPLEQKCLLCWVPEGSLAGICWVGFWGLGGPWGL